MEKETTSRGETQAGAVATADRQEHTPQERERVKSIFTFLKGMAELRTANVLDIEKQPWRKYMAQIPRDDTYVHISCRDTLKDASEDGAYDDWILRVRKSELSACPPPENALRPWLLPGWENFEEDVRHHAARPSRPCMEKGARVATYRDDGELFEADAGRVRSYRSWVQKREMWAQEQRHLSEIREFFIELRRLSEELKQDSETKELMVGSGLLTDVRNAGIRHPILLKRVQIRFDERRNEIAVCDSDADAELYTAVLSALKDVNYNAVAGMQQQLAQNAVHPLDRTAGCEFLKIAVHQLSPASMFLPDGQCPLKSSRERLFMQASPVLFMRRRVDGLAKFVDGVLDHIDATGYVPQPLWTIAGLHEKRTLEERPAQTAEQRFAELGGEDPEILLAMPANREQLAIAQQIAQHDAVIVQGPPGTGKTHTIANLMGHFLAQGKRILVTSHTKKALSVLREKMPAKLQSLCVSLLDETNRDMERSIGGISEYMSRHNSDEMRRRKEAAHAARSAIIQNLADVRKRIYQIECREHESLVYDGESLSPAEAAKFVQKYETLYAPLIPGRVAMGRGLPLSPEELGALYRSNGIISAAEEQELARDVPDPKGLIAPAVLDALRTQKKEMKARLDALAKQLDVKIEMREEGLCLTDSNRRMTLGCAEDAAIGALRTYLASFGTLAPWHMHAVVDGQRGSGYRARWELLCTRVEETATFAAKLVGASFGNEIRIDAAADRAVLQTALEKMAQLYRENGKIGFFKRWMDKSIDRAEGWVRINGAPVGSAEDCELAANVLLLEELRAACARSWDELLAVHDVTKFCELDANEPECVAQTLLPDIRRYLDWYAVEYAQLCALMERVSLRTNEIFPQQALMSGVAQMGAILGCIHGILPQLVDMIEAYGAYCAAQTELRTAARGMESLRTGKSVLAQELVRAFHGQGTERYAEIYRQIALLYEKYTVRAAREDTLQKLHDIAPGWADAIRARTGIHGSAEVPQDIAEAWRWKQYDAMLRDLNKYTLEEYRRQNTELGRAYREKTEEQAVCSAWEHMLRRRERDGSIQQYLQLWRNTVKRIGKGTGKRAPVLRAQARELMGRCQRAVPAWIMTIGTALVQLDPREHRFDVVIVDEASQADLSALTMLYLGTKIIIVGDDKQVSPLAVGQNSGEVGKLIEMHLVGRIPGAQKYTGQTSFYEVGTEICEPLMLREHFRCVPDIISFSNALCYDGKIKPLRDAADSALLPALVPHRIDGTRDGTKKINRAEAEYTVALIRAMTEMEAYRDKTIGVISLLGSEQADLVLDLLLRSSVDMERHAILCGDAAQFQGDERDVIILNMVDRKEEDGMLRLTRDEKIVQRYNVAVSRARDQLWILHSFPPSALKGSDIRSKLLRYAADPHAADGALPQIRQMADSPFEEAVAKTLVGDGYDIVQQWPVGRYRIDIVVRDGAKKIALECDGDRWHSGAEKVYADMERQMILERLGWQFIRLRGSTYYRDPHKAMQGVRRELEAHDIHPAAPADTVVHGDLVEEVRRRAEAYLPPQKA